MSDDIDIGIAVHETGGGQALVEAMRAKLQSYRQELQNLSLFEKENGGQAGKALANSMAIIDEEVHDVTLAYQQMGKAIDISNQQAVTAFREEAVALRNYLEQLDAAGASIDRVGNSLGELRQRQLNALEQKPTAGPTAAVIPTPPIAPIIAADEAIKGTVADVNILIGQFVRLGQVVDATSLEAVNAFRREGEEVTINLLKLGATDQQLNRIGSTIARVEQEFGAFNTSVATGTVAVERIPAGARRGASSLATLAFAMQAGGGSARGMAVAAGGLGQAIAQLAGETRLAAAATGIGAIITVLAVVLELLNKTDDATKKVDNGFSNLGSLRSNQIKILADAHQNLVDATTKDIEKYNELAKTAAKSFDLIGLATAAFGLNEARKSSERLKVLDKEKEEITKSLIEAQTKEARELSDQTRRDSEKASQDEIDRLKGPFAARRKAADDELKESLIELDRRFGDEKAKQVDREALHRQHSERILAIQRDETEQFRAMFEQAQNARLTAEAKLDQDSFQQERNSADRRYEEERKRIERDRNLLSDPEKKRNLELLNEQTHTADLTAIERDRQDKIKEIRDEASDKLAGLADSGVDEAKIRAGYKKQIDILQAAIASEATSPAVKAAAQQGLALVNALIPEEIAKQRLDQIAKDLNAQLSTSEQEITRANLLLNAHQINDAQFRARELDALKKQRDAVAATIPELEAQAELIPGDTAELEKIEALKTKLLELNLTIMQVGDEFYKLKQAAIESTENAITNLIQSIPNVLVGQGQQLNNINQIRVQLASAQAQLQDVMKGPQTPAAIQQTQALRAEVINLNSQLGQAKQQLITWKTVFLDAARSIISALFDVEARMFAVLFVQKALAMFGGGGGGSTTASAVQMAGDIATTVFAAEGGFIRGPGTATSDSIPARLSDGEYVVRAAAVKALGVDFLNALNDAGGQPSVRSRRRGNGYAAGGLVSAAENSPGGNNHLTVGLEDGLVLRHLETQEGTATLLKFAEKNSNKLRNLLGN